MTENNAILAKLRPESASSNSDIATEGLSGVLSKSASVAGLNILDIQVEADCGKAARVEPLDFLQNLPAEKLVFKIECETEGQIGLIVSEMNLVNAVADVLTGPLGQADAPVAERAPTPIDIALTRPYLDEILSGLAGILAEFRPGKPTDAYHTCEVVPEPSPHQFPDQPYLSLSLELDFEKGARRGQVFLLLPASHTEFVSSVRNIAEDSKAWKSAFNTALNEAPAVFSVVLHRKHLPIGKITRLRAGDIIEIPAEAIENLSIETKNGATSRSLMRARLGEFQEMRAAKITKIGAAVKNRANGPYLISGPEA